MPGNVTTVYLVESRFLGDWLVFQRVREHRFARKQLEAETVAYFDLLQGHDRVVRAQMTPAELADEVRRRDLRGDQRKLHQAVVDQLRIRQRRAA